MSSKKRVVVVGSGFGGLSAAKGLVGKAVHVTLIDRSNHHLFQPLLYQVATAALNPSDIATATRSLFRRSESIDVVMDEVCGLDLERKLVLLAVSDPIPFDYLVLATGVDYSFFGNDAWAAHAPVLKTMEDALGIRERLLSAFELAELQDDPLVRSRLLTFVVVGGGPTGVEMAGAIAELGRTTLAKSHRRVQVEDIRIMLIEAGDRILSAFHPRQSAYAIQAVRSLGVEVILNMRVEQIDEHGVDIAGERIPSMNVVWCAGTQAREAASWLGAQTSHNNAVIVQPDCSVPGQPDVFVIGDGASYRTPEGDILPGLAPVAKQQGRYVAKLIHARLNGRNSPDRFAYKSWGMMAVVGRSRAVADFGRMKLAGHLAWLLWSLVHLFLLIDFRSRSSVYLSWSYAWFTKNRIARLLTRHVIPEFKRHFRAGR